MGFGLCVEYFWQGEEWGRNGFDICGVRLVIQDEASLLSLSRFWAGSAALVHQRRSPGAGSCLRIGGFPIRRGQEGGGKKGGRTYCVVVIGV